MPTNEFLPFATGGGANVQSQADYAADPDRTAGFQTGVAPSAPFNKAWRQACFMAAVAANMIFTTLGVDVLDDGDLAGKTTLFINTIKSIISGVGYALLASPTFTGVPAAPTAAPGTNTTQIATTAFAAAIAALKANLASPTFTGVPAAPTAAPGTNTTQLATTAFVAAVQALLPKEYFSPNQAIVLTGTGAVAHGLGGLPDHIGFNLICLTGEAGYTAGTIVLASALGDASNMGIAVDADATNINYVFGAGSGGKEFAVIDSTGATVHLTNANWAVRLWAVRK
jgi:hypothetical protein